MLMISAKSHFQPNQDKGVMQSVTDTITPGRKGANETGITDHIANAATAVKDAVGNALNPGTTPAERKNEL